MDKLIIIAGPTGIGKTELSLELAREFQGEIISCDSMQIYQKMDIGTAKLNLKDVDIPHHLIDIIDPKERYSVAEYKQAATKLIQDINSRGKIPFLVGGTGLYINSIVYRLNFSAEVNCDIRNQLKNRYDQEGLEPLVKDLIAFRPEEAKYVDLKNPKRVLRALEIYYAGENREITNFRRENNDYQMVYFALNMDRSRLYQRINARVDKMMEQNLIDEVRFLLESGVDPRAQSMKGIGYKEVVEYLEKQVDYDTMVQNIKQNSRRYAKRQLTWLRRDQRIHWMNREDPQLLEKMKLKIGEKFGIILSDHERSL